MEKNILHIQIITALLSINFSWAERIIYMH